MRGYSRKLGSLTTRRSLLLYMEAVLVAGGRAAGTASQPSFVVRE